MTTNYHTAISVGAAANAATFNTPLGTLDAAITNAQSGVYNVLDYGADNTGVGDSTSAIQAALNACAVNATVVFPQGTYKITGDSAALLTISKGINIRGNNGQATILATPTTGNTTACAIKVAVTDNGGNLDVRNMTIDGLTIFFAAAAGLHGIELDSTGAALPHINFTIQNCKIAGQSANDGKAIKVGVDFTATNIYNNQLTEGIWFAGSADGQRVRDNVIMGTSTGIWLDVQDGSFSHIIESNIIVSQNAAIYIKNGSQVKILNNQIEQIGVNAFAYPSHVVIGGETYDSERCDIIGNNFGGGPNVDSAILLINCNSCVVEYNDIYECDSGDISLSANANYNRIGYNRYRGPGRTDERIGDFTDLGSFNSWWRVGDWGWNTVAQLSIEQRSATGALPVLAVEQIDRSEEFIRFIGESTTDASQSLVDAADMEDPGAIVGWLKIYIEDDAVSGSITDGAYYIPFYSAPTHSA